MKRIRKKKWGSFWRKEVMPMPMALAITVLGLFVGSVFTFGQQYWNQAVEKTDCSVVQTRILDIQKSYGGRGGNLQIIRLICSDGKRYEITTDLSDNIQFALEHIYPEETVTLWLHPNSGEVMELEYHQRTVLAFENSMQKLRWEATGFLVLGLLMYLGAAMGIGSVAAELYRRRSR